MAERFATKATRRNARAQHALLRPKTVQIATWSMFVGSLLALAGSPHAVRAQPLEPIRSVPQVELFTMGRGHQLFERFGHAALCVTSIESPGGRCYNYGTADFTRPIGLGLDVVFGRAEFWVSVVSKETMLETFRRADRTIYVQSIESNPEALSRLATELENEAHPENRDYQYNHFFDNCSTNPRDHIDRLTGGALSTDTPETSRSFREWMMDGLEFHPGLVLLTDLGLGRALDRNTTEYEAMFLPSELRGAVEQRLGIAPAKIYTRRRPDFPGKATRTRAWLWGGVLLILALLGTIRATGSESLRVVSRRFIAIGFGTWGFILVVLALVSSLAELRFNEIWLLMPPSDLLLMQHRMGRVHQGYLLIRLLVLGLSAVGLLFGWLVQPIWPFWALATGALLTFRTSPSPD